MPTLQQIMTFSVLALSHLFNRAAAQSPPLSTMENDTERSTSTRNHFNLRRRLPGDAMDFNFDMNEMEMEEIANLVGILLLILFLFCCCCCRRFSLWDCVALACLWEICCDNPDRSGDFIML